MNAKPVGKRTAIQDNITLPRTETNAKSSAEVTTTNTEASITEVTTTNAETPKLAYLLLNGSPPSAELISKFFPPPIGTIIMCADGAYNWAASIVRPDFLVGDFDSIIGDFPPNVPLIQFEVEKDYTDSHLCILKLIEMGATDIKIFGAGGGRIDHEAANYCLLAIAQEHNVGLKCHNTNCPNAPVSGQVVKAMIVDEIFDVTMESGYFCAQTSSGKIISVVPYSDQVHILYTKGLKYPMHDKILTKRHILGISNVAIADFVELEISAGEALVYLER